MAWTLASVPGWLLGRLKKILLMGSEQGLAERESGNRRDARRQMEKDSKKVFHNLFLQIREAGVLVA